MSVAIFLGPTLRSEEATRVCDALCLPPVAQGDVWRTTQSRPKALGIIDGYFSGAPSVWHKEILWALSQGVTVFGSSSMGALRAAELHQFGMRGVGRIFEAFRDGFLEDDDEVAVVHGPAELGFPPLSEAMVNIRATLERAEAAGVISQSTRGGLQAHAKSLYFGHRTWSAVLGEAARQHATDDDLQALRSWLPQGRIDQKREDALEMLRTMAAAQECCDPPAASFRFERTHHWDDMTRRMWSAGAGPYDGRGEHADVLEELRLEGSETYRRARDRALLRALLAADLEGRGEILPDDAMTTALRGLRAKFRLGERAELEEWLRRNDMNMAALERLVERETLVMLAQDALDDETLVDELRLSGDYPRLSERARLKRALLSNEGNVEEALDAAVSELRNWFFADRLGEAPPTDVRHAARALGFRSVEELDDALRRERAFLQALRAEGGDAGIGLSSS